MAFGGGVASTLAAFLVHSVFEARSVGVFGVSRRTTEGQLQRARTLAECLGVILSSANCFSCVSFWPLGFSLTIHTLQICVVASTHGEG